ncbi:NfeD family protein [Bacillus chungangensis]|uniref:NfeD family protein n=1 Tax=Bacillus chungangensis TaxID=587633 RepID=UPI0035217DAC
MNYFRKGGNNLRKAIIIFCFLAAGFLSFFPALADGKEDVVFVVPIEQNVEKGLHAFLKRAIHLAEEEQAKAIIFDINTPGGAVTAASDIGDLFQSTSLRKVAFVNSNALSAGAFISLAADEIYMVPHATIGAAAIIDNEGNTAGEKAESYWREKMVAVADLHQRDLEIAVAMTNKTKPLTLTADKAYQVGYSEGTVKNLDDLLIKLKLENATVKSVDETFAEKLARFITDPIVVPILLSIASLGLVLELYSPGFGLPGTMGISALLLFFYGHLVAGLAGYESLILFLIGIGLIILEFFIVGGIAGIIGTIAVITSVFLAGENVLNMAISVLIALFLTAIVLIIMVKVFGKRMKFFKKIILTESTNAESGYVSNVNRIELIGRTGLTITPLRPAGTITIDDERIDVVSEGGFLDKGISVKVIKVEGSRIVVRKVDNT